jgi:hypothetical protein
VGSRPDEVDFFLIYLILPAALGPGVDSASNRNEYQESLKKKPGGKVWPARRADNLLAVCLSNVGALTSHNPMDLHDL